MILGIIGNLHTLLVYGLYYKKNKIRNFVLSLSTVDLLACSVTHPYYLFFFSNTFHWEVFLCKMHCVVMLFFILYSYGLLTIISIDRFRMIINPLGKQLSYSQSKVVCIGFGLFILILNVPLVFNYSYSQKETYSLETSLTSKEHQCIANSELFENVWMGILAFYEGCCISVCFVLYITLSVFLWIKSKGVSVKIGEYCCQLRRTHRCSKTCSSPNTSPTENNQNIDTRRKHFVKGMRTSLVFLVVTLVSCSMLVSNVVLSLAIVDVNALRKIIHDWVYFLTVMHLLNNIVNPIIYMIVDSKFRKRSKLLYKKFCKSDTNNATLN